VEQSLLTLFHPPHREYLLLLQDSNVYIGWAVNHLGYKEKRCEKCDERISAPAYRYDLQLQANNFNSHQKQAKEVFIPHSTYHMEEESK